MNFDALVEKRSCGRTFLVIDPAQYPFAAYEFDDEADIKDAYWSDIRPDEWVLDLGASFGGYTLPALAQGANVIAVEPSALSGEVLYRSAAVNGWVARERPRVDVVRGVLWDRSLVPGEFYDAAVCNFGGERTVPVYTLDYLLLEMLRPPWLDRIKFDVEGAEGAILAGGRQALTRYRPALLIEDHDKATDAPDAALVPYAVGLRARVLEQLQELGYDARCHWRDGGGNPFIVASHPQGPTR